MTPNPCLPACASVPFITQVPGPQGQAGNNGANAFTYTTNAFILPAVGASVSVPVQATAFMGQLEYLLVTDGISTAIMQVVGILSPTLVSLNYVNDPLNTQTGNTMGSNALVTPSGRNGTNGTNGGIGPAGPGAVIPAPLSVFASGTAYTLTQTPALLALGTTTPSLVLPTTGNYLLIGLIRSDLTGDTAITTQTATYKMRLNGISDIAGSSHTIHLPAYTNSTIYSVAVTIPNGIIVVPYAATAADQIQLWGNISGALGGANALNCIEASIVAVQLGSSGIPQFVTYTVNPPANPPFTNQPAIAYDPTGNLPMLGWNTGTLTWN